MKALLLLKAFLGVWFVIVILGMYIYAPPAMGLGDLSRIIYFHIPLAWVGVLAYLFSMINGIHYLRSDDIKCDALAASNAEAGLVFTILATVTGAVFAQHTWGAYWSWDPRQTSIFILMLIYGAYFVLRSSVEDEEKRARLASVYSILAFISVPFFVFIIPRLYTTLHPDPIINVEGRLRMDAKMLQVFLASLVGFTGLYFWIYNLQKRLIAIKYRLERGA